jgi:cytoskeleton protein RodZ
LQVRTAGVSWVDVRDGGGRVLVSRVVQAGERLELDGPLPLRMTIGNAAVTRLDFRGRAVDLAPSTRDNVARIELK